MTQYSLREMTGFTIVTESAHLCIVPIALLPLDILVRTYVAFISSGTY